VLVSDDATHVFDGRSVLWAAFGFIEDTLLEDISVSKTLDDVSVNRTVEDISISRTIEQL
jgi:hypothetical protein